MSSPSRSAIAPETVTVCGAFRATSAAFADRPALSSEDGRVRWTWGEYAERVREAAGGLTGLGLARGDTLACWLGNRPEFHVVDAAAIHLGGVPFSVYPTYTIEQAEEIIGDSGARIVVAEDASIVSALAIRERGRTALETIISVDDGTDPAVISWTELPDCAPARFDLDRRLESIRPDDLLTLIYTSGTTGAPKGVQLTHGNVMAQLSALSERLRLPDGLSAISWLPMAHIAERLCTHYFPIAHGWSVTTCDQPRSIGDTIRAVKPEFFFSPPRLWEKMRAGILAATAGAIPAGQAATATLDALGLDRIRVAIVGAAPCPVEVVKFWHELGIPLGEVYGLSETTGVATVNPPDDIRAGTVGTALDGVEVQLSPEGEVLIRGPVVMAGYRNLADRTAEAIDARGWFHSGDVGEFDDDGYLRIVDRIKELIINAAGKNMSPANIEGTVKTSGELIGHVCCIGDARPYNTALITIDVDAARAFARRRDLSLEDSHALARSAEIHAEVDATVARANERLARVEQIKKFTILGSDWIPGGDELTPTMKLKRKPISEKYAQEIEQMYSG